MIHPPVQRARRLYAASMLSLGVAGCSVTGGELHTLDLSGLRSPAMAHYDALGVEKLP